METLDIMIAEDVLLSLGFAKNRMSQLPDWYHLFETNQVKEAPTYRYMGDGEYYLIVYLSPKGAFGEILAYDEFDWSKSYVALHNTTDVVKAIEDLMEDEYDDE